MPLPDEVLSALESFHRSSDFSGRGAVITDLDGTAVHEREGRVIIPEPVEFGLKALLDRGRPIVLNSLRFPLNILQSFGREWYSITDAPIPTVTLNGSLLGRLVEKGDSLAFEEIEAFPLRLAEIEDVLGAVGSLLDQGVRELLLFHYPRDWTVGEIIWTPDADRIPHVTGKYNSASRVISEPVASLRERLSRADVCMILLLIDLPQDRLMAYQHAGTGFRTRAGVDKREGAIQIARHLGVSLADSVGAGDTVMDTFLREVGLSIHVGNPDLPFEGRRATIRLRDSLELGELLFRLADLQGRARSAPVRG
jgi:hypothetical protein